MTAAVYTRVPHAAHYGNGQGHDLEQWDVLGTWGDPRPACVPHDAEPHSGYIDRYGDTRIVYVRRAPLSDAPCRVCGGGK